MNVLKYILDTNILVHFVRGSSLWADIRSRFNLFAIEPVPMVSIVCHGELRSFSLQADWGARKLDQMEFCLDYFRRETIDADNIVEMYAKIDHFSIRGGRSMGKNDLWIAATAAVKGATLITTDHDFGHLAPAFFDCLRIDPR